MNKELKKFLETEFKTKARIIDSKIVEVTAPDGEVFTVYCQIGALLNESTLMSSWQIYKSRNTKL